MALYYSGNAMDWVQAGIVDYHLSFGRHFTYPHMIVDGEDLLIVMRATYAPGGDDRPPPVSPYGGYYKCAPVAGCSRTHRDSSSRRPEPPVSASMR